MNAMARICKIDTHIILCAIYTYAGEQAIVFSHICPCVCLYKKRKTTDEKLMEIS